MRVEVPDFDEVLRDDVLRFVPEFKVLVPQVLGFDDEVFRVFDGIRTSLTGECGIAVRSWANIHQIRTFVRPIMI